MATLHIRQVKSANGSTPAQRDTLRTLGLRGSGSATDRPDDPVFRGMVATVRHLVETRAGSEAKDSDG